MGKLIVFGTWWCGDCKRVRRYLDQKSIEYDWVDIDKDLTGEKFVLDTNNGMRSVPTIVFMDDSILVEPNEKELQLKIESLVN